MSLIDFNQEARNQGFLHIAVKDLGEESHSFFNGVLQALTKLPPIQLTEPKGTVLFLRFLNYKELPSWASEGPKWSEFNPHKQIRGVLGVCRCYDLDNLDNVIAGFKTYSNRFESSLCECRCIIYGSKSELEGGNIDINKGHCLIDSELGSDDIKHDCLTEIVTDFALAIYSTLKSRITQLNNSLARTSSVTVLHSPFESKEYSHPEDDPGLELKLTPTHIKARMEKHLADMSLLVGDLKMAFHWYTSALQLMRPHQRDNLWYASVNEGLGVTAIVMKLCEEVLGQKAQGFTLNLGPLRKPANNSRISRVSSSSSGGSTSSPRSTLTLDPRRQSSLTGVDIVRPKYNSLRKPVGTVDGDGETDKVNGSIVFKTGAANAGESPSSRPALSDEDESGVYGEEDDDEGCLQVNEALLHKDFIVDKYTVALKFYDKAKHLGVVSLLEALLKFSKYLIDQKSYRVASDQLQRMLAVEEPSFINATDKLQLHCTIAEMYRSMGLHRKAALFTHYAARWASKIAESPDQVIEAYNLIVTCLPDYKLSLQLAELPKNEECYNGWPLIQAQVLKDFVFLSRRKQENELTISHSCYLLRYLAEHLSSKDVQEITLMLKNIVEESLERDNGSPNSATIKKIQSPLPLENIPSVKSVSLVELVDLLKPIKIKGFVEPKEIPSKQEEDSPFIFSPYEARRRRGKQRPEVLWVVGNPGEIKLIVENTLPFDLRVSEMLILTEGAQVEIFPTSLTLPSESEPQDIKLITVPQKPGLLDIKGYEAVVFGILHHECKVKIPEDRIVRVVPPLPEIRLSVLPASDELPLSPSREGSLRVTRPAITKFELLDGEICKYDFQLECLAKAHTDVELITVTVADYDKDYCDISWDDSEVKALLPILSGSCGSFTVSIRAKIPAWFRVLNEHTQGISKTTVFPNLKQEQLFQDSGHHSYSANTTPRESPTSSPIAKRNQSALRSSLKSKSGHDYSSSKGSVLMDSLDLDHPALTSPRSTASLPHFRRSPGHQRNTSLGGGTLKRKNRGSKRLPMDIDVFDIKRASMVSIRSDPGDEGKSRPKLSSKGSESSKAVAIPKSIESRASPISNSPHLYSENGIPSSVQSSNLHRTSSGNKSSTPRKQQQTPLTKGSISVPMGPLIREKPQPPSRKNLEGEFKIQYSGGGGYAEGYCRQCFTKLPIVVKPCLVFEHFEVLSTEKSRELFNLKYFVHNISKIRVEVSVSIDQNYDGDNGKTATSRTLDPNGRSEMVLAIRRFIVDNNKNDGDVTKLYSEKVGEVVKVHWKDLEHNKLGVVALDGLRLSASTVSLMRPIPLMFSFLIDDHTLPSQSSYSHECGVGDQVNVVVAIRNSSGVSMAPSFLVFEPQFHSQQLKRLLKDVGHMILHSGSLIVGIPQLDPGKKYVHKLTFVFLLKGKYHMEIKNYLQVEGPPSLQFKLPATSASQVETTTPTIDDSKNDSTQTSTSASVSVDTSLWSSLSPPREGSVSPLPSQPRPLSPRQSPSPRRSISSPDSPANLARQMAKIYEAKIVARSAIVYKEPKTDKANAASASATKEIKSPEVERTSSVINSTKALASIKTSQRSPEVVFKKPRVDCDRLNILLSEFVSGDSLLKGTAASPVEVTRTNNPTPPPLPRGYHGKLAKSDSDSNKRFSSIKQDHSSRFQELLRLRSQSPKSVRVFSGPQITFSVS